MQKEQFGEVLRPELNMEKWSVIWQPIKSQHKRDRIVVERKLDNDSTSTVEATANTKYGPLTTEAQKVYYALIKMSEEQGHPRQVHFSRKKIARIIKRAWSGYTFDAITKALYQLNSMFFVWKYSFHDVRHGTKTTTSTFTILSKLHLVEYDANRPEAMPHSTKEDSYFEFNDFIYYNLVANYTKPLLLDVIFDIHEGIAQNLYLHLDLMLANNNTYERRTENLFKDLQIEGEGYKYVSQRSRVIERVIEELQGKALSSGGCLSLDLLPTVDKKDCKLIATKTKSSASEAIKGNNPVEINQTQELKPMLEQELPVSKEDKQITLLANFGVLEMIGYFYQVFGINRPEPTTSEINQAKKLIEQYSLNEVKAKYIINYAKEQAALTNFSVQFFGGIKQYIESALVNYERSQAKPITDSLPCDYCQATGFVYIMISANKQTALRCPHDAEKLQQIANTSKLPIKLINETILNPIS